MHVRAAAATSAGRSLKLSCQRSLSWTLQTDAIPASRAASIAQKVRSVLAWTTS